MKSKTSFFNWTVLKKDITRFFPLWGLYSVFLVLYYTIDPILYLGDWSGGLQMLQDLQLSMGIVNMCYAALCAMILFGDLYKSRLCNALHAMPVTREGWFFTHTVAALLFSIVPNTLLAVFIAPILDHYWYLSFLMLGISALQFITFYCIAVFAVMCAGSKFGMAVTYFAIHFWPLLIEGAMSAFIYPLTYGLRLDEAVFSKLSPLSYTTDMEYIRVKTSYDLYESYSTFEGIAGKSILSLSIMTIIGLLILGGALLLYRRRKLETAGDFIVLRPVAVIFHVLLCMFVAAIFMTISESYIIGFFGIIVGFFAGSMLLQRKVGVFKKRSFAVCGIVLAAAAVLLFVVKLDPLRLTWKIPKGEEVKSARIDEYRLTLLEAETPEEIELVLQMHQKIVQQRPGQRSFSYYNYMTFEYTLQNGKTVRRYYPIYVDDLDRDALKAYYSNWQRVFDTDDWDGLCNNLAYVRVVRYVDGERFIVTDREGEDLNATNVPLNDDNRQKVLQLLETMKAECGDVKPSIMGFRSYEESEYFVEVSWFQAGQTKECELQISSQCTETVVLIETLMEAYCTQ